MNVLGLGSLTGDAHCYVGRPLKVQQLLFQLHVVQDIKITTIAFSITCGTRNYNFKNLSQTAKCEIRLLLTWALYII